MCDAQSTPSPAPSAGLFQAILAGASYRAAAIEHGISRTTAENRFKHLAAQLQTVVGVEGIEEDELPTLEMVRRHRGAFEEALQHYRPDCVVRERAHSGTISDTQLARLLRQTARHSRSPLRDRALLLILFGTGARPGEIARLEVRDYLNEDGTAREESTLPAGVAHNGRARTLYFSSARLRQAVDAYLEERRALGFGVTGTADYRGLAPDSRLFLTRDGAALPLRANKYAASHAPGCLAILEIYRKLFRYAGTGGLSALAVRRSVALRLRNAGMSYKGIGTVLGISDGSSVRKLFPRKSGSTRDIMKGLV